MSPEYDAVVIGAGFTGLYALYRLRELGMRIKGYEAGEGPGGTWYWNRYPGAQVDIESLTYSYSFDEDLQQEWHWPEDFSKQKDLEAYANHVADRFDLRKLIQFETRVDRLRFDEDEDLWHVHTDAGDHVTARYVIAATGSLNATNIPEFKGRESFAGESYHTAQWPKERVEFAGKRVGVIGTGSSGVQIIPEIAKEAAHLTVFQRTANFSMPSRNRPMDPEFEREYKKNYRAYREKAASDRSAVVPHIERDRSVFDVGEEERERILNEAWAARSGFRFIRSFNDVLTDAAANEVLAEFVRNKIRQTVRDPEVAELLCPKTHPLGTKRPLLDDGYYETFNRDNVELVDVRTNPIVEITPAGLRTTAHEYELDMLVYATGFDAMTGALTRMTVTGVGGGDLRDKWAHGPANYLGLVIAGFPNLFMVHGPGSPSVLAQMITTGEWQVDWIGDRLKYLRDNGYRRIEATADAEAAWGQETKAIADATLFPRADSWYVGANIPGKPRVFMVYIGGFPAYKQRCDEVVAEGYRGFALS
ncbi:flavin-containing monooxygenase [Amycolatopsis taiwanensis]|uniref:Cyclohexanone monooxygenase n=1 Tax=Amycolatopsis taiwanensis TaxID=342230 RepID=A0A9W6RC21_9PSEU|nr:NAD(P)/FAD-dependent oxidoreductase [Amycolatopsis taiwanensis]GLY71292.1 cyclohexanone monooxygenase [Amycolatopsis taiwanensis]